MVKLAVVDATVVNAMAFVKPMAVMKGGALVMMPAVQAMAMLEAVVREVLAVVQEVVEPDTKAAKAVARDTKTPVMPKPMMVSEPMPMDAMPAMVTASMNSVREPSPGRHLTRQGKHQGGQENPHGYHV